MRTISATWIPVTENDGSAVVGHVMKVEVKEGISSTSLILSDVEAGALYNEMTKIIGKAHLCRSNLGSYVEVKK